MSWIVKYMHPNSHSPVSFENHSSKESSPRPRLGNSTSSSGQTLSKAISVAGFMYTCYTFKQNQIWKNLIFSHYNPYLLLCNKLSQTQWLKTNIRQFTFFCVRILGAIQLGGFHLSFLASCWPELHVATGLIGEGFLPCSFLCLLANLRKFTSKLTYVGLCTSLTILCHDRWFTPK